MKWEEFRDFLIGLGPETALGRIVAIRAEEDKEILKTFTKEQHQIRNAWRSKRARRLAETMSKSEINTAMNEFKNLSKVYDNFLNRVEAIKDINLTIEDGDIFGIIGVSGAGKSTLIRFINFLEKPTEGKVIFDGVYLGSISKKELLKKNRTVT